MQIDGPFVSNGPASITKITPGDLILNNGSTAIGGKMVTGDIVGGGGGGNVKFGNVDNAMLCARPIPDSSIPPHQTGIPFPSHKL